MAEEGIGFFEYWKAWIFIATLVAILFIGLGKRVLGWWQKPSQQQAQYQGQPQPQQQQQQQRR